MKNKTIGDENEMECHRCMQCNVITAGSGRCGGASVWRRDGLGKAERRRRARGRVAGRALEGAVAASVAAAAHLDWIPSLGRPALELREVG